MTATTTEGSTDVSAATLAKITETLKNLQALKDDPAATPAEAEAAAAGITRLCFRYNLSIATIGEKSSPSAYVKEEWRLDGRAQSVNQKWKYTLLYYTAQYNFCRTLYWSEGYQVIFIGKPHNVAIVKSLYEYLSSQVAYLTVKYFREAHPTNYTSLNNTEDAKTWKRSFKHGVVQGLAARMQAEQESQIKSAGSGGTALVVDTSAELDKAFDKFYGLTPEQKKRLEDASRREKERREKLTDAERAAEDAKKAKANNKKYSEKPVDYAAFLGGLAAAKDVNLNKQVESKAKATKAVK